MRGALGSRGQREGWGWVGGADSQKMTQSDIGGNETTLIDTLMVGACHYIFVQTHGMYPRWYNGKESTYPSRRHKRRRFHPWIGEIPWRRKWQPTPVASPGKFYGQEGLGSYSPGGGKVLDMTEHTGTHEACHAKSELSRQSWTLVEKDVSVEIHCNMHPRSRGMLVRERLCLCKKVQEGQGKSLYLLISSAVNLNVFLKMKSNSLKKKKKKSLPRTSVIGEEQRPCLEWVGRRVWVTSQDQSWRILGTRLNGGFCLNAGPCSNPII